MSVKIMGMVWDLDNDIIDREEKYVLLAYTDHADHEGNNMYPSIALICQKTGYKERAAQMITHSLEEKGFLIAAGKGPKGTNKWSYGGGAKNAGVQNLNGGGAKFTVEGVQQNAPEPLRNKEQNDSFLETQELLSKASPEWALLAGVAVDDKAQILAQIEQEAINAFESAFALQRPWDWYPDSPNDKKRTWDDFRAYIVKLYQQDKDSFGKYVTWSRQPYVKGAMTALGIKRNPQDFPDSWVGYLAQSVMYKREEEFTRLL